MWWAYTRGGCLYSGGGAYSRGGGLYVFMFSPMFPNAAGTFSQVFQFSLEVFNSSITSLSATTKREAIVFIAIQNKKLPALASQPIR